MSVIVRLVLLSGAAAAISLFVRDPLAGYIASRAAEPAAEIANVSRTLAPRTAMLPMLPRSAESILPMLPPTGSYTPIVPVPLPRATAKTKTKTKAPEPGAHVITRKQLEDAMASRLAGARAVLVRDEAGHPLGLRLSHVGALAPYGVQEGDVLVSANGLSLRTPEEALAALGKLQDAKQVTVTFHRGTGSYAVPVELRD